jgi:hypothetical protein
MKASVASTVLRFSPVRAIHAPASTCVTASTRSFLKDANEVTVRHQRESVNRPNKTTDCRARFHVSWRKIPISVIDGVRLLQSPREGFNDEPG